MPEQSLDKALQDQQNCYDESWSSTLQQGKEQRGNLITNLAFLKQVDCFNPEDTILEIGCGIGTMVDELSQQGYQAQGTDISNSAIRYGQEKYPGIHLEVQAAERLSYSDQTFDVVLSFDLLEHIAQVDLHVSEVARVLKPGGAYLLQTPNKWSNIVYETLDRKSLEWRRFHPSLHTPGQLRRRLAKHGFSVTFVKMNPINEFSMAKLAILGPLGKLVAKIDFTRIPLWLQTNLYAVARKQDGVA